MTVTRGNLPSPSHPELMLLKSSTGPAYHPHTIIPGGNGFGEQGCSLVVLGAEAWGAQSLTRFTEVEEELALLPPWDARRGRWGSQILPPVPPSLSAFPKVTMTGVYLAMAVCP